VAVEAEAEVHKMKKWKTAGEESQEKKSLSEGKEMSILSEGMIEIEIATVIAATDDRSIMTTK
jgi:hypothetical protein